ncbi:MAG: hypothetical protein IH907_08260 [Proteobacteria bacterium]|nr:hypothetical protein [Pseudomonadota bacterium]
MKRFSAVFSSVVLALLSNIAFLNIVFAQDEQLQPPNATAARLDHGPKPMSRLVKFPGRVTDENFTVTVIVELEVSAKGKPWRLNFTNELREYDAFYRAIKRAAKKAKVKPAMVDGKPVKISTYATFVFSQKDRKRLIYFYHHCGLEDPAHSLGYIGPQVIGGYQAYTNAVRAPKISRSWSASGYLAVIHYDVTKNGHAENIKIIDQRPSHSKWGPQFVAGLNRLKFIPATLDGIKVGVGAADYIGERYPFIFSNAEPYGLDKKSD